jgi:hypothetical protein
MNVTRLATEAIDTAGRYGEWTQIPRLGTTLTGSGSNRWSSTWLARAATW